MIQLQSPSWGIFDAVAFVGGVTSTAFVQAALTRQGLAGAVPA